MLKKVMEFLGKTKGDLLSGLTVALALVPEAVAFAFIAGVEPLVGLYAASMVGFLTAVFGGRPGMISGAAGALAVVMVSLVADHGVEYLFAAVILMGFLQILAGCLKLGKFIRMVPRPVMLGFINGLATVIFLAQLSQFGVAGEPGCFSGTFLEGSSFDIAWLPAARLIPFLGLIALTMAIIHYLPKVTKAIPAPLVAIGGVTALVLTTGIHTQTVGDVASISGGLPVFHFPTVPLNLETLQIILPYSMILAAVGLIESLLTLRLIDEITETRGNSNRECIGQGIANTVTGLFGGMGGCAMIGQSVINVNSGGRGRLSGIVASLSLLGFILVGSPFIEMIPVAALVGIMFVVAISTFEWSSFRIIRQIPRSDAFVLFTVSTVTVLTDLAVAVIAGVIISALVFAWKHAKQIRVERSDTDNACTRYMIRGSLFFGSSLQFLEQFTPKDDKDYVVVDFSHARVCDHSALEAIDVLSTRYRALGRKIHMLHLSKECRRLLHEAGELVDAEIDPLTEDLLAS